MALLAVPFHDGIEVDGAELRRMVQAVTGGASGCAYPSTSLAASAQSSPDLTVKVAAGHALINASGSGLGGTYHVYNDADLTSPTFSATGGSVRTDRLVLRITSGVAALEVIAGTPGSATPPTITGDNVIPICRVEFPVSTSTVTNGIIVDERTFFGSPVLVCTSSTRPSAPFEGLRIYETDTNLEYVYTGAAWQLRGVASDFHAGPLFKAITPGGNLDESGGTLDAWSGTVSLAVPAWATKARVQTSVNGVYGITGSGLAGVAMACRIGSTTGTSVAVSVDCTTSERVCVSWSDEIDVSGVAGTTSTIQVYARISSGSGSPAIRADTSSDFGFLIWFGAS